MPDREIIHIRPMGIEADEDSAPTARACCTGCGADLTPLPAVARFCNHCGSPLGPRGASVPTRPRLRFRRAVWTQHPPNRARLRWWSNLWGACPGADEDIPSFPGRSAVLLAYGKSMFNLGWRYEHAFGARRNLSEADRCYQKAARLGDSSAADRLDQLRPD